MQQLKDSGADRLLPGSLVKGGNPYDGAAMRSFSNLLKETGLYDNETAEAKVTGMYVFRKRFSTYGDEQKINVCPFAGDGEGGGGKDVTEAHYITLAKGAPAVRCLQGAALPGHDSHALALIKEGIKKVRYPL